jgi:Autographiviridae endonuclease VII
MPRKDYSSHLDYCRKRYEANKEKIKQKRRERYRADPDKEKEANKDRKKKWAKTERGKALIHEQNRRRSRAMREFYYKKKYGIDLKEYTRLFKKQKGKCAICKRPPHGKTRWGREINLVVDHCHETGKVRGLLCRHCNLLIGRLTTSTAKASRASAYLRKHSAKH